MHPIDRRILFALVALLAFIAKTVFTDVSDLKVDMASVKTSIKFLVNRGE